MKSQKVHFLTILFIALSLTSHSQQLKTNLFVRTPQVVNYNFRRSEMLYNPVVSVGAGLSYRSHFVEMATFIDDDELYGFYTFFGTTLATKELKESLKLHSNWFGEITFLSQQPPDADPVIYTSGACFFLNQYFEWGAIGIPLCIGIGYNDRSFSLNTRVIFNLSLNLQ